jgi:hypothetical protein
MAKEKELTPLEVAQVATSRFEEFHPWALATARTIVKNNFGDKWGEKNPLLFENLQNSIAVNLVIARGTNK